MIVDNNTQPDIVKVEDINETTFSQAYSIIFDDVLSGKLYAEITDKDGLTKSISFNLIVEEGTTPLQAEEAFEWKRVGGDDATGLDMFGLKWTWNGKAVNAKIEKDGADKFVQLAAADWTNFETVEDLMAAVEAGDNIDVYEGVSAEVEGSYDDVLATYYNGEYYIIHVEESTIVVETAGTTITISGNYKK